MIRKTERRLMRDKDLLMLLPNGFTLASLCAGLTAMRYGLDQRFELAMVLIGVGVVLDGLDGRAARLLNRTSRLGAELDSLADFVSFGVAPAFLVYLWTLNDVRAIGWAVGLIFACCCALRLARFNSEIDNPPVETWRKDFFRGLPAPAAGAAALLPMMLYFGTGITFFDSWIVNVVTLVTTSLLMVSNLPILSIKQMRVPPNWRFGALVVLVSIIAATIAAPWLTLSALISAYLVTIPFTVLRGRKLQKESEQPQPDA